MNKIAFNRVCIVINLLITSLFLVSAFVIDKSLFRGIIVAKHLWVQSVSVVAIIFIAVRLFYYKKLIIKPIDVGITLMVLWMIARELFSDMPHANPQQYILNIAIFYSLYLFFRTIKKQQSVLTAIVVIYLLVVSAQAIIGLLQLYGVMHSHHGLFKITGTFHNPGPFSGFVMSGLPMALALYIQTKRKEKGIEHSSQLSVFGKCLETVGFNGWCSGFLCRLNTDKLLNCFAQFVIVVLLLVLPAARSRAAWLGGIIGCLYVIWQFRVLQKLTRNNKIKLSGTLRKTLALIVILLLAVLFFGLYKFKQGSADGRLLIWQVSWEMIKDKPLIGWGQGGFEANYANYQAEWFKSGLGTDVQALVAGIPDAPFNELIRVWMNYGGIGVAFLIVLLILLLLRESFEITKNHIEKFRGSLYNNYSPFVILKGGLNSILIFSIFSYPLDVTPILVQLSMLIGLLANYLTEYQLQSTNCKILSTDYLTSRLAIIILIFSFILFSAIDSINTQKGLRHLQRANELYQFELYMDASREFELAKKYITKNGLLMQMQAKCFAMLEKWNEAISIAHQVQDYRNGQIVNIILGDAYKAIGNYEKSEEAYKQACIIIPHRFLPNFLLVKMYNESGHDIKALRLAKELLNKRPKVVTIAIIEMRDELQNIINQRKKEKRTGSETVSKH